ncbi:MAG: DUF4412 domain-containing protein [Bacteroidia bacterium]|nr:DUF4412 domain-containing protein [Bacteroidia bacterium]
MFRILIFLFPFFLVGTLSAQSFFEGTMSFKVELSGEMAEMLAENEPHDQMTMHIKDGDYIVLLKGGRYPKTFLFVADSNYEYSIDAANQMVYKYSAHMDVNRETHQLEKNVDLKAENTGETAEVNGIMCQIYKFRKPDAVFYYYVSDDYRVDVSKYPENCRAKASFLADGLDGRIPLKTVRKEAKLTVVTTLTNVTPREFDLAQFRIPTGFALKKRDYRY